MIKGNPKRLPDSNFNLGPRAASIPRLPFGRVSLPRLSFFIVCLTDLETAFARPCLLLKASIFIRFASSPQISLRIRLQQIAFSPTESPTRPLARLLNQLPNRSEQLNTTDLSISRSSTDEPPQGDDLRKKKNSERRKISLLQITVYITTRLYKLYEFCSAPLSRLRGLKELI